MRICQIPDGTSKYPPLGADTSAWETHRISTALTDLGQKVTVVTLTKPKHHYVYNLIPLRNTASNSKYLNKFVFAWALNQDFCRLLEKERYDVVHFHGIIPAAFLLQKIHGKIPTAVTWGDPFLPAIEEPNLPRYVLQRRGSSIFERSVSFVFQKYILSKVDVILPVSFTLKRKLVELFELDESKIEVIEPGVDTSFFKPGLQSMDLRIRHQIDSSSKVVMCPARIAPLKNQEELVKVLPLLKDRFKNVKLLLVGAKQNKKYLSYLKELSRKLGVAQDVVFTGVVSAEDFPRYYNMADVVVLPSVSEGFPSSLIESMSCGRPTVASNIQSNMEVGTFGKDILYYRLNDLHDLYDKITCILNDQTLASALSKSARQTAIQKYDWNVVARRTLDAYFRLIRLR